MAHTPGPWTAQANPATKEIAYVLASDDVIIATVDGVRERDALTNARLIAAAPDLLDVLEEMREYWDSGTPVHPGALVVRRAMQAVSKARG